MLVQLLFCILVAYKWSWEVFFHHMVKKKCKFCWYYDGVRFQDNSSSCMWPRLGNLVGLFKSSFIYTSCILLLLILGTAGPGKSNALGKNLKCALKHTNHNYVKTNLFLYQIIIFIKIIRVYKKGEPFWGLVKTLSNENPVGQNTRRRKKSTPIHKTLHSKTKNV